MMRVRALTRALLVALLLLLALTAGFADEDVEGEDVDVSDESSGGDDDGVDSPPSSGEAEDDEDDIGSLLTDWYDEDNGDGEDDGEGDDNDAPLGEDDEYDDFEEEDWDWEDYDDSWDWEDETFIELDNATDIEFFDDLSAEEMCAMGNSSDANNSLADAFDADLFAEFCADTELADLIDSAMYEVYKEQNGSGFFVAESTANLCADMPELDGCGAVAAPATNATALNVIKGFINDAAKTLMMKNQSLARLFGGVQGQSLIKNITNATLVNQTSSLTGDAYHLWAVRVTAPDDYFIKQKFGAAFVSGYVKGSPGYFLVHAKVSKVASLKDESFPFLVDALPMPYQLRVQPFSAATCKTNNTNCHMLDVSMLGITSFNQATEISKTFKTGLAAAGHNVTVRVASSKKIVVKAVKTKPFDIKKISAWLAKQQKVERVAVGTQFSKGGRPGNVLHYSGTATTTAAKTPLYNLWADGTLAGQGQVVMVGDTGLRAEHCWYQDGNKPAPFNVFDQSRRKLVAYGHNANSDRKPDEDGSADHGTHCAGLVAGQDTSVTSLATGTAHTGTAWKAKIAFYDVGKDGKMAGIPDMGTVYLPWVQKAGAYISSNSWGSSFDGAGYSHNSFNGYDSKSIDEWSYENDNVLVLVANGNDGDFGTFSSGSPANCKNCLSVGSADKDGNLGTYSSRGPTADGRIKPDIVGVGTKAVSSDSRADSGGGFCKTVEMTGTSMATPAVAGTLAVLRQYLTEGYYPTGEKLAGNAVANPSAALMKAMLINGAEPVYNIKTNSGDLFPLGTVPSMYQGWGMARMDTTLPIKGTSFFPSQIWDRQTVTNGEVKTIDLNFEPGAAGKELCVTLVYWDIVSWVQTKQALVNDLDLMVVVGGKVAFYPNGLAGPDRLNTVERVCLRTTGGAKAEYKIYVTGAKVTTGSQRFSLVASSRSVKDRKKPNCRTDVCNDFTFEEEITTIDKVTKKNWDSYMSAPSKYVELCEYTKKDECAAKKSCRWCSVGGAGRCHRKNLASASMCPSANPTTPVIPSSGGAAAVTVACSTTVKTNNCNGCAAMSGCNWCTFGGGRSGCLKDSEKAAYTCVSSAAQCPASPIPGGIKIGLTSIAAINVVVASPPPPSPPPSSSPPVMVAASPPAAKKSPPQNTAPSPPPYDDISGAPPRRRETAVLTFLAALVVAAML